MLGRRAVGLCRSSSLLGSSGKGCLTHLCGSAACAHCIARSGTLAVRAFSAAAASGLYKEGAKGGMASPPVVARSRCRVRERGMATNCRGSIIIGEAVGSLLGLAKPIEMEIEFNERLIREEDLALPVVLDGYKELIREAALTIEDAPDGTTRFLMPGPAQGSRYVIAFDCAAVTNAVNTASELADNEDDEEESFEDDETVNEEEEEEEEEEEDDDVEDSYEEEEGEEALPFNVTVEIHRDGPASKKFLELAVEATMEPTGEFDLLLVDMVLRQPAAAAAKGSDGTPYSGPSFDTLDEGIRAEFDGFVRKHFARFIPLVAEYAQAREAKLYSEWLKDVKSVLA